MPSFRSTGAAISRDPIVNVWSQLFGRTAPVEIEIGPERGTFLFATAALHPERNYLGIERSSPRVRRLERTLRERSYPNVRVLSGDAACVIEGCVPPSSVAAVHIYFPDPWWKRRHHRRRLLTPEFAAILARTLEPAGAIYLVTDVEELFRFAMRSLRSVPILIEAEDLPPRPVRTAFEKKAMARGDRLFGAAMFRRSESAAVDIGAAQALR